MSKAKNGSRYIYTLFMGRTQEVNAIDLFSEEEKKKEKKKCGK